MGRGKELRQGSTRYMCTECDISYTSRHARDLHIRVSHPNDPRSDARRPAVATVCRVCGKFIFSNRIGSDGCCSCLSS